MEAICLKYGWWGGENNKRDLGIWVMRNLDRILKSITLQTKVYIVKAMVFPVVTYRCESWITKNAEHQGTDAFELWCWRRLLGVPWTARRSTQSILKEINNKGIWVTIWKFVLSHSVVSDSLRPPMDCSLPGTSVHGASPGKNTGVGCHALLQEIFWTQGSNSLTHCNWRNKISGGRKISEKIMAEKCPNLLKTVRST